MIEFSAGKDVAADRGGQSGIPPAAATKALKTLRAQRDRVVEVQAARLQQAIDCLEIGWMVGDADVLEHADRSDLVKAAFEARVVAHFERYLVFELQSGDFFL